jgi:hypothetical protein
LVEAANATKAKALWRVDATARIKDFVTGYNRFRPLKSENTNKIKNTTKQILAIVAAVPATTPKPRTPARMATIRKISA